MITKAAILFEGMLFIGRDYEEIASNKYASKKVIKYGEKGFITDEGLFLDPYEAVEEAIKCGQISEIKSILLPQDLK